MGTIAVAVGEAAIPGILDASVNAQQSFDQFGHPCQCVLATINGQQVLIPTGSMIGPYGFMSSSADELNQAEQAYAALVASIFADMYMDYFKYKGAYLKEESDCYWNNGTREIQYSLFNASGNPLSNGWVTEHQTDTSLTVAGSPEGPGTSSQGGGDFDDLIGGLGFADSKQNFTVSSSAPGRGGRNFSVYVQTTIGTNQGNFGTLGIYINGGVYVNGDITEGVCN